MAKSTKVPKDWEPRYAVLTGMTDRFCADHLNSEYAELARQAIAALCRKRPSPIGAGKPETWACAVLYALGQINFLTDKETEPYLPLPTLYGHFGIAASTAGNKAKLVRELLGMHQFDHRWMLPSLLDQSPALWLIQVNGFVVDARRLPLEYQQAAAEKGLIPHTVPSQQ
jgi:hypothetical protein